MKSTLLIVSLCLISCTGFNGEPNGDGASVGITPEPVTVSPFESFTLSSDQSEVLKMTIEPTGTAPLDYGFNEATSALRGRFLYDSLLKELYYERSLISGTAWNDFTLFPPDSNLKFNYNLANLVKVSARVYAKVNGNSGSAQCGIAFGFGDSSGHINATSASTNLRLGGRDWALATNAAKRPRDYLRFSYDFNPTLERVVVDAPINSYNQATEWTKFSAAEWREAQGEVNFISASSAALGGDYASYTLEIISDTSSQTLTISISDISSNLDTTGGETSKAFHWDYSKSIDYVDPVTSNIRNGLDLTNVFGTDSMSITDFQNQVFHLGFTGNQSARECRYSDLKVTVKN